MNKLLSLFNWSPDAQEVFMDNENLFEDFMYNPSVVLSSKVTKELFNLCKNVDEISFILRMNLNKIEFDKFLEKEKRVSVLYEVVKHCSLTKKQYRSILEKTDFNANIIRTILQYSDNGHEALNLEDFERFPGFELLYSWLPFTSEEQVSNEYIINLILTQGTAVGGIFNLLLEDAAATLLRARPSLTEDILNTNNFLLQTMLVTSSCPEKINFEVIFDTIARNENRQLFGKRMFDLVRNVFVDLNLIEKIILKHKEILDSFPNLDFEETCQARKVNNIFFNYEDVLDAESLTKFLKYDKGPPFLPWVLKQPNFKDTPFGKALQAQENKGSGGATLNIYFLFKKVKKYLTESSLNNTPISVLMEEKNLSELTAFEIETISDIFQERTKNFTKVNWETFFSIGETLDVSCQGLIDVTLTV